LHDRFAPAQPLAAAPARQSEANRLPVIRAIHARFDAAKSHFRTCAKKNFTPVSDVNRGPRRRICVGKNQRTRALKIP
jgi:hypothetical protein